MAATNYTISLPLALALNGNFYKQLVVNQTQLESLQKRLIQLNTNITTLQEQLRALQVQILAGAPHNVTVAPGTPIVMTVNNDGTVTLAVG
jgi:hypothetical protein